MSQRLALVQKAEPQIKDLISQGKGYDALRIIVTISNRYQSLKSNDNALRVAFDGATQLLISSQENTQSSSAALEAATHYVNLAKALNFLDDSIITNIKSLFALFPIQTAIVTGSESPQSQIQPHIDFMKLSLGVARSFRNFCVEHPSHALKTLAELNTPKSDTEMNDDESTTTTALARVVKYETTLHHTFALFCFKHNLIHLGNQHFIYAIMPVQHVLMITPHISTLSLHEQGLCVIRIIAMYLCLPQTFTSKHDTTTPASITTADQFLHTISLKLPSKNVQPLSTYLHCAANMITVAKLGDEHVYETMMQVYSTIFEQASDHTILQLVNHIGAIYCGVKKPAGLLDALFG